MAKTTTTATRKAIEHILEESTVCENWMTDKVHSVRPSDSVAQARELLKQHRINQLPVIGVHQKLLGIVTDRDLRKLEDRSGAGTAGEVKDELRVEEVMTHPVITLGCHSTLVNAAEVMRRTRIGAVPIVSGEFLVGIVTRSDILDAFVALAHGKTPRRRASKSRS